MSEHDNDKLANAREQAMAQYDHIVELVIAYQDDTNDDALEAIHDNALSVGVRSDWSTPGEKLEPAHYMILLCTGGPAVRIVGQLNEYGEPRDAGLECQDWFTPWTQVHNVSQDTLLAYAGCFYFGEG